MASRAALEEIVAELGRIRRIPKCTSCECLLGVLQAMQTDMTGIDSPAAAASDIERWLGESARQCHPCLGCDACLPTEPYIRFNTLRKDIAGASTTH